MGHNHDIQVQTQQTTPKDTAISLCRRPLLPSPPTEQVRYISEVSGKQQAVQKTVAAVNTNPTSALGKPHKQQALQNISGYRRLLLSTPTLHLAKNTTQQAVQNTGRVPPVAAVNNNSTIW
jgi:hypothetical protein